MTGQLLSSKVVFHEESPRVSIGQGNAGTVVGAVGITERGPVGKPVLCTEEELHRIFGGFTQNSDMRLALKGFFENVRGQVWVVRTVHYTDVSDADSGTAVRAVGHLTVDNQESPARVVSSQPGPYRLQDGDRLVLLMSGGDNETVTIKAQPAQVSTTGSRPFVLAHDQTLVFEFEDGREQTVVFDQNRFEEISEAQDSEVAAVINEQISGGKAIFEAGGGVRIASDTHGSGSRVRIVGGTANAALGFPTAQVQGTGNVNDAATVMIAELRTLVEDDIEDVVVDSDELGHLRISTEDAGEDATIQILASTAEGFGFDSEVHVGTNAGTENAVRIDGKDPGAYANQVQVEVREPMSGDPGLFDLLVIEDGVYRESFPGLSLVPTHERYIDQVINHPKTGSVFIRTAHLNLPENPLPSSQIAQLTGGDDGLVGLDDTDFIGSDVSKTGIHALDAIQDLSLLMVPGRATPAVHNAMVAYCEVTRDGSVFPVLDPPENMSAVEIVDYVQNIANLLNLSEYGAIYWPRVKVLNPAKSVFGSDDKIVVPPSGIICGVYARTDAARPGGIYDPPAGVDKGKLVGVLGFETDEVLEERKRDLVYPKRINPLTTDVGMPPFIDGSRTLKSGGNFPYVAERRGVIFIKQELKRLLQFTRHKNNTEGLRAQAHRTITAFLITQMNNGAFRYRDPQKAFFVDVSDQLNTELTIFEGRLLARVGLATNKAVDWVVIGIGQDTRILELQLAAAA